MVDLPKRVAEGIGRFTGRAWLLPKLLKWWEDGAERLFLLTGGPGTGKSTIAAWLSGHGPLPEDPTARDHLITARSVVKAVHFCEAASRNISPHAVAESIANQLTRTVPPFADALAATLADQVQIRVAQRAGKVESGGTMTAVLIDRLELGTLSDELSFDRVCVQPLKKLYDGGYGEPMLLLVDALDEAQTYAGVTLPYLLARLADLPPSVRIMATTRDDPQVLKLFRGIKPFDLIRDADAGVDDVQTYSEGRLAQLATVQLASRQDFAVKLAKQADGIFLYASMMLDDLLAQPPSRLPDLATRLLPDGLSGLYQEFLNRELGRHEKDWFDLYEPLLGLIAVAQGDGLTSEQLTTISGRDIRAALRACKQYIVGELPEGPFQLFHKSLVDFLFEDKQNIDFHIDARQWHKKITDYYWARFSCRWTDCDAYGADFLLLHAIGSENSTYTDRLIEDAEFLVVAEPDSVMEALQYVRSERARSMALAYGHVAHLLRNCTIGERRSYLGMSLLQNGISHFPNASISDPKTSAPWLPAWTDCIPAIRYFRIGHDEAISAIASGYLGDRACVVSGDVDGQVRVSDILTGATIGSIPDRRVFAISALALYSLVDQAMIVIGDREGMVECWDLTEMKRLWGTNGYHWNVECVIIAPLRGRPVVVSCSSDAIYAFDLRSGNEIGPFGSNWNHVLNDEEFGGTYCLASYVDGSRTFLLSGHDDGMLRIWDLQSGNLIKKSKVDGADIHYVETVERDGKRLIVSATVGRSIKIIDGETFDTLSHIRFHEKPNSLPTIAIGEFGKEQVLYSADQKNLVAFALLDGRKLSEGVISSGSICVIARACEGDGAKILLGCDDRELYVIDETEVFCPQYRADLRKECVTAISNAKLGNDFFACGHADGAIYLRDPDSGQAIPGHEWHVPGPIRSIETMEYQGNLILACLFDGGVWICHKGKSTILANADRSDSIMSVGLGMTVGRPVMAIGTDSGSIETYAITPEVTRLNKLDGAHTWRSANLNDPQTRLSNITALAIASIGDRTVLASAGWEDQTIKLWDWATLRNDETMRAKSYIMRLRIGLIQTKLTLISLHFDLRCKFWDPRTGQLLREFVDPRVLERGAPYESESLWYVDMAVDHVANRDLVAIAARDGTITVIDADSLALKRVVSIGYGAWGQSVVLAPSGVVALASTRGITAIRI
ncbi:WD40 repeat domain-containing protein [Bradyrhizobium diazoefficiens]